MAIIHQFYANFTNTLYSLPSLLSIQIPIIYHHFATQISKSKMKSPSEATLWKGDYT